MSGAAPSSDVAPTLAEAIAAAQREDWEAANEAVQRALAEAPADLEVHLVRGRVLRASGGDQGALIRAFRRASECDASPLRRAEALREYASALIPIGRHKEAAASLALAVSLIEEDADEAEPGRDALLADLADELSLAHERDGEWEPALHWYRRGERSRRSGARDIAESAAREASLLERLGRYDELFGCYRRLIELNPDRVLFAEPDARPSTALRKRLKALLLGINQHLAAHPDDVIAHGFKAGFFFRLGRYRQAEQQLTELLAEGPEHFYAHHLLGKVRLKVGRTSKALAALERARTLGPQYYDLERDLALALEQAERIEEALDVYGRIVTRWPGRGDDERRAAVLCERLGRDAEAYEGFKRLARANPDPASLEKIARLAVRLGQHGDAAAHLLAAIELLPPGSEARVAMRLHRAEALGRSGEGQLAFDELTALIERCEARGQAGAVRRAELAKGRALHEQLGRPGEALTIGEALLAREASDVEALLLIGDALKGLKQFAESVNYYARAADQRLADALLDEGSRLHEGEQFARAIDKLHEAFRKTRASWEIYYCAATAYARLGEARPAAKYLEAAVKQQRGAIGLMQRDGDFDAVRGAPELTELVARLGGASA